MARNTLVVGLGFAVMLLAGLAVFPRALYAQWRQPLQFRHKTHAEKSGGSQCNACAAFRDDGTFAGLGRCIRGIDF